MNRRKMIMVLAVLIVILAGCGKQTGTDETTQGTIEPTVESSIETTAVQESIPGIEDSEFDDATEPTAVETQSQTGGSDLAETTKPTDSDKSQETTKPTEADKPQETTPPTEAPKPTETTKPTEPSQPSAKPQTEYENFQNMSAADQQAYMESFDSMDTFFDWYNNAKAEHEAANPPIDVGDGSIDMGDLMD